MLWDLDARLSLGQTSIINRFCRENFGKAYEQTVGSDFYLRRMEIPGDVSVTLQIWDIGGQSLGSKMIDNYLENAHAIVLVYDLTSISSFQNLEDWLELVRKRGLTGPVALLANKCDQEHLRAVKATQHNDFVAKHHLLSFCVSAKSGDQIFACFRTLVGRLTGIAPTSSEMEAASRSVIKADIVDHPNVSAPAPPRPGAAAGSDKKKKSSVCVLQ